MPALRQLVKPRTFWIKWIAAAAVAAAAIFDWTRAPEEQASVWIYERAIINPYRAVLRPATSRVIGCRYHPTCSRYSVEAVRLYGFPSGGWMTLKRVLRCMPWVAPGTHDPVPPRVAQAGR